MNSKTKLWMRFLGKTYTHKSSCIIWMGAATTQGYGVMEDKNGVSKNAHRAMYELVNGPIPPGMHVCHTCDVRLCVNPRHLWVGTIQENMIDKIRKGRQASGEKMPNCKLTAKDRKNIVSEYASGKYSQSAIAKKYGVAASQISRTWLMHCRKDFFPSRRKLCVGIKYKKFIKRDADGNFLCHPPPGGSK